ncbi:flavin reductase family protein (plasmid) [Natrinema halophilum]|nr:flavin reductase family protein [Natrinema halophilum]
MVTLARDPPHGLTANAFTSVSLDPPLVLVSVDHETKTYELLESGEVDGFCVNILSADQQFLGEYFAGMADDEESPFESEATTTGPTGAVIFEESLAYIDCEVYDAVEQGDHTLYIGEVQGADVLSEDAEALTFFRGEWGSLA